MAHAATNENKTRTIGIVKLFSGNIGTNSTLKKWKFRTDAICPRCGHEDENPQHVVQCKHPEATERWNTKIRTLRNWMEIEASTKPSLADAIIDRLNTWRNQQGLQEIPDQTTRKAAREQEDIGWWNFTMGLHSKKWQEIQKAHYARIGSRRSPKRWTSQIIRKLWDIAWDLWRHRCRIAHGIAEEPLEMTDSLDQSIRDEANRGPPPNCPTHYKQHFSHHTTRAVLRQPHSEKTKWLQFTRHLRNQLNKANSEGSTQQQCRTMYAFLCPANPNGNQSPKPNPKLYPPN